MGFFSWLSSLFFGGSTKYTADGVVDYIEKNAIEGKGFFADIEQLQNFKLSSIMVDVKRSVDSFVKDTQEGQTLGENTMFTSRQVERFAKDAKKKFLLQRKKFRKSVITRKLPDFKTLDLHRAAVEGYIFLLESHLAESRDLFASSGKLKADKIGAMRTFHKELLAIQHNIVAETNYLLQHAKAWHGSSSEFDVFVNNEIQNLVSLSKELKTILESIMNLTNSWSLLQFSKKLKKFSKISSRNWKQMLYSVKKIGDVKGSDKTVRVMAGEKTA